MSGNISKFAPILKQMLLKTKIHYNSPGSMGWTAFLEDGALRENSPNAIILSYLI
jgi:hypothetical protein